MRTPPLQPIKGRASLKVPTGFLDRFKSRYHAFFLPKLNGMTINQLSGTTLCFVVILANDLDPVCDVPILAYDEGIVALHLRLQGFGKSMQLRPARSGSRPPNHEIFLVRWTSRRRAYSGRSA